MVVSGFTSFTLLIVFVHSLAPPSLRSSRSTEVITQCLSCIALIDSASLSGSWGSGGIGFPVFVAQNYRPWYIYLRESKKLRCLCFSIHQYLDNYHWCRLYEDDFQ